MARILLAWELGAGIGHVRPLMALSTRLRAAGHDVLLAARDVLRVRQVLATCAAAQAPFALLAAPAFPGLQIQQDAAISALSDVLWFEDGGHGAEPLAAQFCAWRELIAALRIDLLVSDAAPLAQAAADGLCPRLGYGGYFHLTDPAGWRIFRDWERIDRALVERRAQQLLEHLNLARQHCGLAPVDSLAAGFGAERHVLRVLPALDPYGVRPGVVYAGSPPDAPGMPWSWPYTALYRAKVLAYLRAGHPQQQRILGALARLAETAEIVCHYEGLPASARPAGHPHLHFVDHPIDLEAVLPASNAVLCHGGSLLNRVVMAGKPALVLPTHTEQFLAGRQLQASGAGLLAQPLERPDVLAGLRAVLSDPRYTRAASEIAAAWKASGAAPDEQPWRSVVELLG